MAMTVVDRLEWVQFSHQHCDCASAGFASGADPGRAFLPATGHGTSEVARYRTLFGSPPRRRAYVRAAYLYAHWQPLLAGAMWRRLPTEVPPFPDATESRNGGRDMPREPSMRTAFFSARPYDRHFLEEAVDGWQPPISRYRGRPGFPAA